MFATEIDSQCPDCKGTLMKDDYEVGHTIFCVYCKYKKYVDYNKKQPVEVHGWSGSAAERKDLPK